MQALQDLSTNEKDNDQVRSLTTKGSQSSSLGHSLYRSDRSLHGQETRQEGMEAPLSYDDRSRNRLVRDR